MARVLPELKNCPFCGGTPKFALDSDSEGYEEWAEIYCTECCATIEAKHDRDLSFSKLSDVPIDTLNDLAAKWNRRFFK